MKKPLLTIFLHPCKRIFLKINIQHLFKFSMRFIKCLLLLKFKKGSTETKDEIYRKNYCVFLD